MLLDVDPCLSLDSPFLDISALEDCINFALYKSYYYYYYYHRGVPLEPTIQPTHDSRVSCINQESGTKIQKKTDAQKVLAVHLGLSRSRSLPDFGLGCFCP